MKISEEYGRSHQEAALLSAEGPTLGSDGEEVGSEVVEGIRFLETGVEFKDVKDIENFTIAVDSLVINSELSKEERVKYYELCCSQESFLHDNLLGGISVKLAAGAIAQTVDISDAIKSSKLSTSQEEFMAWDNSLGALEQLGMNVGFLRIRIQKLLSIASAEVVDSKHYIEAVVARAHLEEEITSMKAKLDELNVSSKRFDTKIKTLKRKARKHERKFQAEVNSPW